MVWGTSPLYTQSRKVQLELDRGTCAYFCRFPFLQDGKPMTSALIVVALAGISAYLVRRVLRVAPMDRGIDVGPLSTGWIAEQRRQEPR